jgi:GT2 family glycosyltransferase
VPTVAAKYLANLGNSSYCSHLAVTLSIEHADGQRTGEHPPLTRILTRIRTRILTWCRHTLAYVSIRTRILARILTWCRHTSAYVSIRTRILARILTWCMRPSATSV